MAAAAAAAAVLTYMTRPALRQAIVVAMLLLTLEYGVRKGQCIYSNTCRNMNLAGSVMTGECNDGKDNWVTSHLDLNEKVGNRDGILICASDASRFLDTCRNAGLDNGHVLSATCPFTAAGVSWDFSACVDLDHCVMNRNGYLQWSV